MMKMARMLSKMSIQTKQTFLQGVRNIAISIALNVEIVVIMVE